MKTVASHTSFHHCFLLSIRMSYLGGVDYFFNIIKYECCINVCLNLLFFTEENSEKLNMPPPPPESPHAEPAPRKRRRKREDPQSCFANSEVSNICFICSRRIGIVVKWMIIILFTRNASTLNYSLSSSLLYGLSYRLSVYGRRVYYSSSCTYIHIHL